MDSISPTNFADKVAKLCVDKFNELPKTGKPQKNEWTILAAVVKCCVLPRQDTVKTNIVSVAERCEHRVEIVTETSESSAETGVSCKENVSERIFQNENNIRKAETHQENASLFVCCEGVEMQYNEVNCNMEVVALGTGSKCLGTSKWCTKGSLVHDSHAEVVAKRSFQLYLMDQVEAAQLGRKSIYGIDKKSCDSVPCQNDGTDRSLPNQVLVSSDERCSGKGEQTNDTAINSTKLSGTSSKLVMKSGISFHFFISHTPCGDCSIFPKQENSSIGECVSGTTDDDYICKNFELSGKAQQNLNSDEIENQIDCRQLEESSLSNEISEPDMKKFKGDTSEETFQCNVNLNLKVNVTTDELLHSSARVNQSSGDIHRTGAKCASGESTDNHLPGHSYHVVGPLRTKPGRGDRTLSHCCSDKLLKWSVLGLQGSLLMSFLRYPIYLETVVIGLCPYNSVAMERGLFARHGKNLKSLDLKHGFKVTNLNLLKSGVKFAHSKDETKRKIDGRNVTPCPSSVSWHPGYGSCKSHVMVDGRKIGITKKNLGTVKSHVPICRYQILKKIVSLHLNEDKSTQNTSRTGHNTCHRVCILNYSVNEIRTFQEFHKSSKESIGNVGQNNEGNIRNVSEDHSDSESGSHWNLVAIKQSYRELKEMSVSYRETWKTLKENVLVNWTKKPKGLQDFLL